MVTTMPQSVKCCCCERRFPPGAVMQSGGKTIPALVVPREVGNTEAAIAAATCQVCLKRQGDPARGLKRVLGELGVSELSAIHAGRSRREPVLDPSAATGRRYSFASPSLADVTIVVPGAPRERIQNRPVRISKPLPPPHPQQRGGTPTDRRASNREMLEAAAQALTARKQAELERRAREREERQRRFDRTVRVLRLLLLRTRKRAPCQDIDERIVTIDRKLRRAAANDAQQRDKNALMALVGTGVEELVELSRLVYLTMSVEPYGSYESDDFGGLSFTRFVPRAPGSRRPKKRRAERAMTDAFPGGRRPESWDSRGGTRPGFYEFEVIRLKSRLPIPNPPLPDGGEDPSPRIVYPQGGQYGSDYVVHDSTRDARLERLFIVLAQGLGDALVARTQEDSTVRVDIPDCLAGFWRELKMELAESAQASALEPETLELDGTHISLPDLPTVT